METARQCFQKIMHYEKPERMFLWNRPFGFYGDVLGTQYWQQTIERWYEEGLPKEIISTTEVNDYFGTDRSLRVLLRVGLWPPSEKRIVDTDDKYEIFYDVDGALVRQFKGAKYESAIPEHIKYPVTSRKEWKTFRDTYLNPSEPGRERFEIQVDGQVLLESAPGLDNFVQAKNLISESEWPVEVTVGSLFGYVRNWMGLTNLSYMLYDDRALVVEMMDHLANLSISVIRHFLEALDVDIDYATWWEDMAFNKGPLISPKFVDEIMVPRYQKVNQVLIAHGIDIIGLDSDGSLETLIPFWLDGGINFVYPNEVAAGNNVLETRRKFGPEMRLVGGFDKRVLSKDKAAIKMELERLAPLLIEGGYLLSVDHSVPPDISFENYLYFMETYRSVCESLLG
jgi:uroporphyrinogen decarboxylase